MLLFNLRLQNNQDPGPTLAICERAKRQCIRISLLFLSRLKLLCLRCYRCRPAACWSGPPIVSSGESIVVQAAVNLCRADLALLVRGRVRTGASWAVPRYIVTALRDISTMRNGVCGIEPKALIITSPHHIFIVIYTFDMGFSWKYTMIIQHPLARAVSTYLRCSQRPPNPLLRPWQAMIIASPKCLQICLDEGVLPYGPS